MAPHESPNDLLDWVAATGKATLGPLAIGKGRPCRGRVIPMECPTGSDHAILKENHVLSGRAPVKPFFEPFVGSPTCEIISL